VYVVSRVLKNGQLEQERVTQIEARSLGEIIEIEHPVTCCSKNDLMSHSMHSWW